MKRTAMMIPTHRAIKKSTVDGLLPIKLLGDSGCADEEIASTELIVEDAESRLVVVVVVVAMVEIKSSEQGLFVQLLLAETKSQTDVARQVAGTEYSCQTTPFCVQMAFVRVENRL